MMSYELYEQTELLCSGRFVKQEQWERWRAKRKLVTWSKHRGRFCWGITPRKKNFETVYEKYCNIVKVKVTFYIAYCYETIIFQYAIVTNRAGVQLRGFWVGKWFPCNAVRIMRY